MRQSLVLLAIAITGCAGGAYLPNSAGGGASDISGPDVRQSWLQANPGTPDSIADGIKEGYFVPGMTEEVINVITNPNRLGTTSNGYWRRNQSGDELRLTWFVSGQQMPFVDGRHASVCELVLTDTVLTRLRMCPPPKPEQSSSDGS